MRVHLGSSQIMAFFGYCCSKSAPYSGTRRDTLILATIHKGSFGGVCWAFGD